MTAPPPPHGSAGVAPEAPARDPRTRDASPPIPAPDIPGAIAVEGRAPGPLSVLRERNFALLWSGAFVSNVGTWLQNVALSWLVLTITDSAFWVSMVSFVQFFPQVLFGLFGGALADRHDRRRILMVSQSILMGLAFALAAVTLTGNARVGTIFPILGLGGITMAFNAPAFHALVPDLVPERALLAAISVNAAQFSAARVVGPAIGGAVVAAAGAGWAFVVNGLTFLAVIGGIAAMRGVRRDHGLEDGRRSLFGGLRAARDSVEIRALLGLLATVSIFGAPVLALLPVLARDVLGRDAGGFGALFAVFSAGAVAGSLGVSRYAPRIGMRRAAPGGLLAFAALLGVLSMSRSILLSGACLAGVGCLYAATLSVTSTGVQRAVPASARGRVMSLYMMSWAGVFPLGALAAGAIAEHVGAPGAIAIFGSVLAVTGAVAYARRDMFDNARL